VDLDAPPDDLKVEFLFQLFDDALADVAEGSDVIGEDLHADGHEPPRSSGDENLDSMIAQDDRILRSFSVIQCGHDGTDWAIGELLPEGSNLR